MRRWFQLTAALLLLSLSDRVGLAEELLRANLHVHDRPAHAIDIAGQVDHFDAGWAPSVYEDARKAGLDAIVMNPHGNSMINGQTPLRALFRGYPGEMSDGKPVHWENEKLWASEASILGLRAFEWSGENHVNVIGSENWTDKSVVAGEAAQPSGDFRALCKWLLERPNAASIYGGEIVCQFNHVYGTPEGNWRYVDFARYKADAGESWRLFSLLQILTGPLYDLGTRKEAERIYYRALKDGWRVGPTVGADNLGRLYRQDRLAHTGVWVAERTQASFLSALRQRRVFATTDGAMELDLAASVASTGASCVMGGTIDVPNGAALEITVKARDDDAIGRISLIEVSPRYTEPHTVDWFDAKEDSAEKAFTVMPSSDVVCYYVRVDDWSPVFECTWSAPIFMGNRQLAATQQAVDLTGRWEGKGVGLEDGVYFDDKVAMVQAEGTVYHVWRRHKVGSDEYIVWADESSVETFIGEQHSSGQPPEHILEQKGSWQWAIYSKSLISNDGDTIYSEASFASGKHVKTTLRRVAKLAGLSEIGNIEHQFKGLVKLGEEVAAGRMTVSEARRYLLVFLNYPGSKLELTVIDPDGNAITPDSPGVTYVKDEIPTRMYIPNPKQGTWSFKVKGVEVEGDAEPFWLIATYTDKGPYGEPPVSAGGGGPPPGLDLQTVLVWCVAGLMIIVAGLGLALAIKLRRLEP